MNHLRSFKIGSQVKAQSFTNQTIIGQYRGPRNSFGIYVYGSPAHTQDSPQLHICRKFGLESLEPPKSKKPVGRPPNIPLSVEKGDPCTGYTKKDQKIFGHFTQFCDEQDLAYIRGWLFEESRFNQPQWYKVLRMTIRSTRENKA